MSQYGHHIHLASLFSWITYLLWIGGINVEGGGQYIFQAGWRGDKAFFRWREGGGEGFFKVETKVPEEYFSNSIAWSLIINILSEILCIVLFCTNSWRPSVFILFFTFVFFVLFCIFYIFTFLHFLHFWRFCIFVLFYFCTFCTFVLCRLCTEAC